MKEVETSVRHHYVPEWYQRNFLPAGIGEFFVFDKAPNKKIVCPDGIVRTQTPREIFRRGPRKLFTQDGFYSVALRGVRDDAVERLVFGPIDDSGARANKLFRQWPEAHRLMSAEVAEQIPREFGHPSERMIDLTEYLDAQKTRTPRGIAQIKLRLAKAGLISAHSNTVMASMLSQREANCTVWAESFWEMFLRTDEKPSFLLSDDPVVLYNMDCFPGAPVCRFPNDPHPFWRGTRVLHPLSKDRLLVLTHVEHVDLPVRKKARKDRTHARSHDDVLISYTDIVSDRKLTSEEVASINFVIKSRAIRYVAAADSDDLFPERVIGNPKWAEIDGIFAQPYPTFLSETETYIKYKDESLLYSDAFGNRDYVPGWFIRQNKKNGDKH